ncbi:hypothetical protein GDO81_013757 [Engystomops pustulosus]|uniref:Uncharacterized protein n=1 Tax=Engystomops pustulosus TaxID=76066 RepID=A0AAV7B5E3_ENGPU|nr:hypothetical protein GDO81_013757 [Engystomops pustulosus]
MVETFVPSRSLVSLYKSGGPFAHSWSFCNKPYTWDFPFCLQIHRTGTLHLVRQPEHIPAITGALNLPSVEITDLSPLKLCQFVPRRAVAIAPETEDARGL